MEQIVGATTGPVHSLAGVLKLEPATNKCAGGTLKPVSLRGCNGNPLVAAIETDSLAAGMRAARVEFDDIAHGEPANAEASQMTPATTVRTTPRAKPQANSSTDGLALSELRVLAVLPWRNRRTTIDNNQVLPRATHVRRRMR